MKFPRTIAAVQKRDRCMWEIGDALLAECGRPSVDGVKDGSWEKLELAVNAIEAAKVTDYTVKTLSKIRSIAFAFSKDARRASLSWSAHADAGSPEMLSAVVRVVGPKPTRDVVRTARQAIEIQEERKEQQKRRADPEYKTPPQRKTVAPTPKEATGLAFLAESLRQCSVVSRCNLDMGRVAEWLEKNLRKLEQVEIDELVEECLVLADTSRRVAEIARKLQTNRRAHLSVVGKET